VPSLKPATSVNTGTTGSTTSGSSGAAGTTAAGLSLFGLNQTTSLIIIICAAVVVILIIAIALVMCGCCGGSAPVETHVEKLGKVEDTNDVDVEMENQDARKEMK
jgi:hypothetical protein